MGLRPAATLVKARAEALAWPTEAQTMPDPKSAPDPEEDRDLDEALEETFPASDAISPMEPRERTPPPSRPG